MSPRRSVRDVADEAAGLGFTLTGGGKRIYVLKKGELPVVTFQDLDDVEKFLRGVRAARAERLGEGAGEW